MLLLKQDQSDPIKGKRKSDFESFEFPDLYSQEQLEIFGNGSFSKKQDDMMAPTFVANAKGNSMNLQERKRKDKMFENIIKQAKPRTELHLNNHQFLPDGIRMASLVTDAIELPQAYPLPQKKRRVFPETNSAGARRLTVKVPPKNATTASCNAPVFIRGKEILTRNPDINIELVSGKYQLVTGSPSHSDGKFTSVGMNEEGRIDVAASSPNMAYVPGQRHSLPKNGPLLESETFRKPTQYGFAEREIDDLAKRGLQISLSPPQQGVISSLITKVPRAGEGNDPLRAANENQNDVLSIHEAHLPDFEILDELCIPASMQQKSEGLNGSSIDFFQMGKMPEHTQRNIEPNDLVGSLGGFDEIASLFGDEILTLSFRDLDDIKD